MFAQVNQARSFNVLLPVRQLALGGVGLKKRLGARVCPRIALDREPSNATV